MQACYAHAALDGWQQELFEWAEARERVERMAKEFDIKLLQSGDGINPCAIAVLPDAPTTLRVGAMHAQHGVGARRWWSMGCHGMSAYRGRAQGVFAVTDDIAGRLVGLPLYRRICVEDVQVLEMALNYLVAADVV